MIQSKDLRIGNYIEFYGDTIKCGLITLSQLDYDGGEEYEIKPIPLSKDWLIKLGGKVNGASIVKLGVYEFWSNTVQENDYSMRYPTGIYQVNKDVGRYEVLHSVHNSVTHVHQLQNLYFALTGEELSIIKSDNDDNDEQCDCDGMSFYDSRY